MKTAVDFLHSEYNRILGSVLVTPQQIIEMSDALENAKEMEKEQIKTAYLNGNAFGIDIDNGLSPSHYYNETFKQQEQ
jgi:hypothetical protein